MENCSSGWLFRYSVIEYIRSHGYKLPWIPNHYRHRKQPLSWAEILEEVEKQAPARKLEQEATDKENEKRRKQHRKLLK
jgi:hypothetical protein